MQEHHIDYDCWTVSAAGGNGSYQANLRVQASHGSSPTNAKTANVIMISYWGWKKDSGPKIAVLGTSDA